jgi:hypothetical protein
MRAIAALAILFSLFFAFSKEARADGTWCARYPEGASNCGFYSFAHVRRPYRAGEAFVSKTECPRPGSAADRS